MARQMTAKQERVVEAVRGGLVGDAAVEFIRHSGYAMNVPGIARHLRKMGGRGRVQELIDEGLTNREILETCLPGADLSGLKPEPLTQGELFKGKSKGFGEPPGKDSPLYTTTKLSIRIPAELSEAIRAAAQAEHKSQNQLIVDLLASILSREPRHIQQEIEEL